MAGAEAARSHCLLPLSFLALHIFFIAPCCRVQLVQTCSPCTSFVPCGRFGWPYLGKAQQPQKQRYPFLSVCAYCPVSKHDMATGFSTCAQTLMHAIAHEGCVSSESGRLQKSPCHTEDRTWRQNCAWPFGPSLRPLNHRAP